MEPSRELLGLAVRALEFAGVAVVMAGVVWAAYVFARDLVGRNERAFRRLRANLGRGILLGLEILVGADLIETVAAPLTPQTVLLLGGVVLIRTFLSFSLETEIEGRWPWKRHEAER